jgi:exoribonuclease R
MSKIQVNDKVLSSIFGASPYEEKPDGIRGILYTKDYIHFTILSDAGHLLHTFIGAKLANKCLPGDHVVWANSTCELELRNHYPLIVGTVELTRSSTYGLTKRGIPMYLFTPYDKSYPPFIVGCSEKDKRFNKIGLIQFEEWVDNFPRGSLQQTLGPSGDMDAEKHALIWQACPWRYPKHDYQPERKNDKERQRLQGYTFHIDPEGCKDVDDVLTFEQMNDSCWRVTITISDVAAYVEDGSAIDIMASLIGQTLYSKEGKMIRPMLPAAYSEQACSLLPGKESYGVSLQFVWDGMAIHSIQWLETVLQVDKSYSYEEFQEASTPYHSVIQAITTYLAKTDLTDSHEWIEQMMIFYNTEAGKKLKAAHMGILRRHSAPDQEKWKNYMEHVPALKFLAMQAAEYVLAEESDTVHYGLSSDTYAHASSPIRRYADLVNQRILKHLMHGSTEPKVAVPEYYIVPITMHDMNARVKAIKRFARDMDFVEAWATGKTVFTGIIMDRVLKENARTKVKIYIPEWKRMISATYKTVSDDIVLSQDETTEINVSLYREVQVHCTFMMQSPSWKERVILQIN